jgi:DNA-binding transcriptional LysR family regulator
MELRHLRYFAAVAEERHFGRAAARLHIAQPPLSRQIRVLEEELGVELFSREPRRIELTPAGRVFYDEVRQLFSQLDRAIDRTRRSHKGESGSLLIGYIASAAYSAFPDLLRTFRTRFPSIELSLREGVPAVQIPALLSGELDVGFLRAPVHEASLTLEPIFREPLYAALPAQHRLAGRARISLDALASEPFVFFMRHRGPGFYDLLFAACVKAGFSPRVVQEVPEMASVVSLVAAGFGVSIVPASIRHLRRDGIVFRPLRGSLPQAELVMAWRADRESPVLRSFIDVAREVGVRLGRKRSEPPR